MKELENLTGKPKKEFKTLPDICHKKMTWEEALEFAHSNNMKIPNKAEVKEMIKAEMKLWNYFKSFYKIPIFWTSTTYIGNCMKAYLSIGRPVLKTEKHLICLIK